MSTPKLLILTARTVVQEDLRSGVSQTTGKPYKFGRQTFLATSLDEDGIPEKLQLDVAIDENGEFAPKPAGSKWLLSAGALYVSEQAASRSNGKLGINKSVGLRHDCLISLDDAAREIATMTGPARSAAGLTKPQG